MEPFTNGPLFTEMHFYQRCCKKDQIEEWLNNHKDRHKLKSLAIPFYIACGNHTLKSQSKYRFLVMEKFGLDLEKSILAPSKADPSSAKLRQFICFLAIRLLYGLQYIHEQGYVHSDIKASNIMVGINKTHKNQVFLLDYGLVSKYKFEPHKHKEFKIDAKKGHDGTIEFTSIDAHNGTDPSRRSDLEILGYNLIKWSTGSLPWEKSPTKGPPKPDWVLKEKNKYLQNIPLLMKTCYKTLSIPNEIQTFFQYFIKLKYEEIPNYEYLREEIFNQVLKDVFKTTYRDDFFTDSIKANIPTRVSNLNKKNVSNSTFPAKLPSSFNTSRCEFVKNNLPTIRKTAKKVVPHSNFTADKLSATTSSSSSALSSRADDFQRKIIPHKPVVNNSQNTATTSKRRAKGVVLNYKENEVSDDSSSSSTNKNRKRTQLSKNVDINDKNPRRYIISNGSTNNQLTKANNHPPTSPRNYDDHHHLSSTVKKTGENSKFSKFADSSNLLTAVQPPSSSSSSSLRYNLRSSPQNYFDCPDNNNNNNTIKFGNNNDKNQKSIDRVNDIIYVSPTSSTIPNFNESFINMIKNQTLFTPKIKHHPLQLAVQKLPNICILPSSHQNNHESVPATVETPTLHLLPTPQPLPLNVLLSAPKTKLKLPISTVKIPEFNKKLVVPGAANTPPLSPPPPQHLNQTRYLTPPEKFNNSKSNSDDSTASDLGPIISKFSFRSARKSNAYMKDRHQKNYYPLMVEEPRGPNNIRNGGTNLLDTTLFNSSVLSDDLSILRP